MFLLKRKNVMHDKRHTHPNWMILYLKPALKHGRQSCGEPCSSIDIHTYMYVLFSHYRTIITGRAIGTTISIKPALYIVCGVLRGESD